MSQFLLSQLIDRALDRGLPANIVDSNDGFEISVKVPGVAKSDISVDIQGRVVTVAVNKSASEEQSQEAPRRTVHMLEYDIPAKAERSFQFRETLDAESASLELADGILKINVGYLQRAGKRTLTVA